LRLRRHKNLSDPVSVVSRFVDAANRHDAEGIAKCLHPEFESIQPIYPARNFRGAAQVRRNWQAIFESEPGFRLSLVRAASADNTVWVELHGAGADVEVAGVFIMGVEGDVVRWARVYSSVVEQVGPRVAPPDPETPVVTDEAVTLAEEAARIRQQVDAGRRPVSVGAEEGSANGTAAEAEDDDAAAEDDDAAWADAGQAAAAEDQEEEVDGAEEGPVAEEDAVEADVDAGIDVVVGEAAVGGDAAATDTGDAVVEEAVVVSAPVVTDDADEDEADEDGELDEDEFDDEFDDDYDDDDDDDGYDDDEGEDEGEDEAPDLIGMAAPDVTGEPDVQALVGGTDPPRRWKRRTAGKGAGDFSGNDAGAEIIDLAGPREPAGAPLEPPGPQD
jgi:hypothetical protein